MSDDTPTPEERIASMTAIRGLLKDSSLSKTNSLKRLAELLDAVAFDRFENYSAGDMELVLDMFLAAEAENARLLAVHAKAVEQIETFLVTDDDNGMALLLSISALLAPPAETDHE